MSSGPQSLTARRWGREQRPRAAERAVADRPAPTTAATRAAMRCLALDVAAVATHAALAERGIDSVLLKGAGLGRQLGVEHRRRYSDVDLLVAPATFDAAQRLLQGLGYRRASAGFRADELTRWHERSWRIPGPLELTVDLHRGFAGVADAEAFWVAIFAAARRIQLAGGTIPIPDEAGAALLLGLHAAAPGRSDKPTTDLIRSLEVFPMAVWAAAAELAHTVGATSAFALGLRQVDRGVEVAATLRLPAHQVSTAQWIMAGHGSEESYALARVGELPTWSARLRFFGCRLVPSRAFMRYTDRRARTGTVGLALAYLLRVGRYARRTPAGVREWRSARRTMRGSTHR